MARQSKNPKVRAKPSPKKVPRIVERPSPGAGPFSWRFGWADRDGDWAWSGLIKSGRLTEVVHRLRDLEGKNAAQLRQTGSHPISPDDWIRGAQQRLAVIGRDEYDEYWSLRITGECRAWAIPVDNVMHVLWWDPGHEICPSQLKHT